MGCTCSKSGTIRVTPSWNSFRSENIEYPSNTVISVKSRNLIRKLSTRQSVNLDLCGPLLVSSKEIQISRQNLWVSSCIIPGVHLQSVYKKKCQDFCFYVSSENSLFAGVFDGHGRYGEKVSNFCAKNISKSFTTSKDLYEESPVHFLKTVLYNCTSELTQNVKIDVYESGTTAALLMLYDSVFYTANIGDSRVVLATSKIPENLPFPLQMISEERKKADELLNNRNVMLEGPIFAVPLTKDQKPEDREELERIVEFGGRVQRITDKTGNKVGPYRI